MWITANAKWYVGWNAWWVYEPGPSLLTYEELVAISSYTDLLEELNKSPQEYFDKLTTEWHMSYAWPIWELSETTSCSTRVLYDWKTIYYSEGSNSRWRTTGAMEPCGDDIPTPVPDLW